MFFNNDYMQNLNYYNQNPYGMNKPSQEIPTINSLYPDIYKIAVPLVKSMIQNTNLNVIDDNLVNGIVGNVLKILEGSSESKETNNTFLKDTIKIITIEEIKATINRIRLINFIETLY